MSTPTKNNRYQNANSSSIYNVKQNVNSFLADFADLDFTNIVQNNTFTNVDLSGVLHTWATSGVTNSTYASSLSYLPSVFSPSGSFTQEISSKLKSNTNYSIIIYGSASISASIEVGVYTDIPYQIINLDNTNKLNQATLLLNNPSSGLLQKHIVHFKTSSTTIQGPIYVKIRNISGTIITTNIKTILVYSSLVELGDLPDNEILGTTGIIPDVTYIDTVYNNRGMAVSGTPLLPDWCVKDVYTNKIYKIIAFNNKVYIEELPYLYQRTPVSTIQINSNENKSYLVRIVNKQLELEEITYTYVKPKTITDVINGCIYNVGIEEATKLLLTISSFNSVASVYQDLSSGSKYVLTVLSDTIVPVQVDSLSTINTSTSGSYKIIKDLYNYKSYITNVVSGALTITETTYDISHRSSLELKDYTLGFTYNMVIEYGFVSLKKILLLPDIVEDLQNRIAQLELTISLL